MKITASILFLMCFYSLSFSQTMPKTLPDEMTQFFVGKWHGKGQFSNGRPIEADIEFRRSLDGYWLEGEHTDVPPNRYKAKTMWSWDEQQNNAPGYVFDNFAGHRKFTSDGWQNDKIVFTYQDSKSYQRFTYEKQSATSFKMTYEVSKDGQAWRVGDWLVFVRS